MIRWVYPNLLHLMVVLPAVAAAAFLLYWRRRRQAAAALGDPALVRRLTGADLRRFPRRSAALTVLAAAALGVASAGPRWGGDPAPAEAESQEGDVVLVLDVSNSMLVRDVAPDRLARQRAAAGALLDRAGGARVGLVVFAGSGHVVAPLTTDHAMIRMYLDALSPGMAYQGGSALSSGIRQAVRLVRVPGEARGTSAALVLMSDGEAHESEDFVRLAIRDAVRSRVPVHVVGIGTAAGGQVPDVNHATGDTTGFKREPMTGEVAVSRLNRGVLEMIAAETGGTYADADAPGGLGGIAAEVGRVRRVPAGPVPGNRYAWFIALALVLIGTEAVSEARGRRGAREA
jgi:Ca-activated chloride channel homolog